MKTKMEAFDVEDVQKVHRDAALDMKILACNWANIHAVASAHTVS